MITTYSEAETAELGRDLAASLHAGSVVLLYGELGAGKTAFVRGLAEGLGAQREEVTSPTFTLMHEYRGGRLRLVHVDLYRLSDSREIEDLGLEEIGADAVLAIEWAEKLSPSPLEAVHVLIRHGQGESRTVEIS